jgi:hypothetical protein
MLFWSLQTKYYFDGYFVLSHVWGSMTNINGFWIGWLDLLPPLQLLLITISYNSSQSMTVKDLLHSLLDYGCLLFPCDWLGSNLQISHFFSFRCPLVNTPQQNTQLLNCLLISLTNGRIMSHDSLWLNWTELNWPDLTWTELNWTLKSVTCPSFITELSNQLCVPLL